MNNKNVLEKMIATEQKKLEQLISYQQYSDANDKQGYVHGLQEYFNCAENQDIRSRLESNISWNIDGSVKEENYGKASYWQSFCNGWEVAKNITQ
jgi:hypothetical protein